MLMEAPTYQFSIEIQTFDGWRLICRCNNFERCIRVADSIAETQMSMTRVVDTIHDRLIVHEKVGPQPEYIDDWLEPKEPEQVNWTKEGF